MIILQGEDFVVAGTTELSVIDDDEWDSQEAQDQVWALAEERAGEDEDVDTDTLENAYFAADEESDGTDRNDYKLPYAKVRDGELVASARGIESADGFLGRTEGLSSNQKERIQDMINTYREKSDALDDPDEEESAEAASLQGYPETEDYEEELVIIDSGSSYILRASGLTELSLPDLEVRDGELRISRDRYSQFQAETLAHIASGRDMTIDYAGQNLATEVTDEDLEIINGAHADGSVGREDIFVFERFVINDIPSRQRGLKFTEAALEAIAEDFDAGRTRLIGHRHDRMVGRTFQAELVEDTVLGREGKFVKTREFIPRTPANQQLITNIRTGVYSFDSIGFHPGSAVELVEDDEENEFVQIDYDPDEQHPLFAKEVSFVHLGEMKSAGSGREMSTGDESKPSSKSNDDRVLIL